MNATSVSLRLPSQAAPIDRTPSPAALSAAGVDASGIFDDIVSGIGSVAGPLLGQAAQTAAQAAGPALASLIGGFL
jgi:hypothetical protein